MYDTKLGTWSKPFVFMGWTDFAIKLILIVAIVFVIVKYYRILKERNLYLLQIRDEVRKLNGKIK